MNLDNIINKISNEINAIKTHLKMDHIKINILDGLLMNNGKPYEFNIRVQDELIGGYTIMELIDNMLIKNKLTNLKCRLNNITYLPKNDDDDQIRVFTFYLFANDF